MFSSTMLKIPVTTSFLKSSLKKAITPLTTTAPSESLLKDASSSAAALLMIVSRASIVPLTSKVTSHATIAIKRRSTSLIAPISLWATVTLMCIALITVMAPINIVDAAPAKHVSAPNTLLNSMSFAVSEASALPLQLQIESQVTGKQQLAYLPTTGPSMDFYYLNYRPTYRAGESKIDFWMLTPKGTPAPKTGSLELYDEFGKIRLAVLVPEGTEIPQGVANKNEPFLWKSWAIPKTLKADFDFSEKFRIVLKTSDSKTVAAGGIAATSHKNKRRFESLLDLVVKGKNKHVLAADNADTMLAWSASASSSPVVVQDRQFRIKGLQATPGGKPNPAKLHLNSVALAPAPAPVTVAANTNSHNNIGLASSGISNTHVNDNTGAGSTNSPMSGTTAKLSSAAALHIQRGRLVATLGAVWAVAFFAL